MDHQGRRTTQDELSRSPRFFSSICHKSKKKENKKHVFFLLKYKQQFTGSHLIFQVTWAFSKCCLQPLLLLTLQAQTPILTEVAHKFCFFTSRDSKVDKRSYHTFKWQNNEAKLLYMDMYSNLCCNYPGAAWVMRMPDHLSLAGIREWGMCHILFKQPCTCVLTVYSNSSASRRIPCCWTVPPLRLLNDLGCFPLDTMTTTGIYVF